ncbi:hypothetical protein [Nocardia huaxiensis]|uniref:Uncharacterized protein n=1 Tax=Nocardia huaxiensis TaxID=2755382 RepID=A0A7D6VAD1_9NOCA|nr:hypothetical protein [Nocardia huaxiensis]QLY29522.1 hypothetical protein H0264_30365 [Nocardia huaxiensis]UFS96920.1 hypothetical protein LPY97_03020 [Nocardia huaxiensis]
MSNRLAGNGIDVDAVIEKLTDASVDYFVEQITGENLVAHADSILRDIFEIEEALRVSDILDRETIQGSVLAIIDLLNSSTLNRHFFEAIADAIYDLAANDKFRLGDVVDRDGVEKLIATIAGMHLMFERGLDRFAESPMLGTVAATFVNRIMSGAGEAVRTRAEKYPLMKSALSLGDRTVGKVLTAGDKAFGERLGEATAAAAQFAVRRTNHAILTVIKETPVTDAAMEVYDLFANEPVSDLREFIELEELRALIAAVFDLATTVKNPEYLADLVNDVVSILLDHYGDYTVAGLVKEVGISPEFLRDEFCRYAPAVIEAAKQDGILAGLARRRIEPFFRSEQVREILSSAS